MTLINRVWALDDTEKVKKDDLTHWAATTSSNKVWDGTTVTIFGGRNEIVAFQLILEATGSQATDVDVVLSGLSYSGSTIQNTSTDPLQYVGRNIEIFLEHYYYYEKRSGWLEETDSGGWGYLSGRPTPDEDYIGYMPDMLVPIEATSSDYDNGQGGAPFKIDANCNQGVWFDIYIPKTMPPGNYTGSILVKESGSTSYTVPIVLTVYSFTLPDQNHFYNMFWIGDGPFYHYPSVTTRYSAEYNTHFRRYMNTFHRHRMNLMDNATFDRFTGSLGEYYTGTAYSTANGYAGPGEGVGDNLYSIGTYDQPSASYISSFEPVTEAGWQAASDKWEQWFLDNAPNTRRFKYFEDEPPRDRTKHATIKTRADWIHNGAGVGQNLKTHLTFWFDPVLVGYVDVWAVNNASTGLTGYHLQPFEPPYPTAYGLQDSGSLCGIYNGYTPCFGVMNVLDVEAAHSRIAPWIAYKYGVNQYFQWSVSEYVVHHAQNPWKDPFYIANSGSIDGVIAIAGRYTSSTWGADDRGLEGPIVSMRMKQFRRGMQDYEYLWMANSSSIDVSSSINAVVPAAFDDFTSSPAYTTIHQQPVWATKGYQFEVARKDIAILLSSGSVTLDIPTLLQPSDGDGATDTTLTFEWSTVTSASTYTLQISTNSGFSSYFYNTSGLTSTTKVISGLAETTKYYWRVSAEAAGSGTSGFGTAHSFTTKTSYTPTPPSAGWEWVENTPVQATNNQPSHTFSHTVSAGNNRLLIVSVATWNGNTGYVTGVTFNGDPLSLAVTSDAGHAYNWKAELWYMVAPDTGAHNVVVSFSSNYAYGMIGATTFTGIDQVTPLRATATGFRVQDAASNPYVDVPNVVADDLVYACAIRNYDNLTSGETQDWMISHTDFLAGGGQYLNGTDGTVQMNWTASPNSEYGTAGAAFIPAAGAAGRRKIVIT